MSSRPWVAFVAVQLVGAVCVWSGPRILSAPGPVLFFSGVALPGAPDAVVASGLSLPLCGPRLLRILQKGWEHLN